MARHNFEEFTPKEIDEQIDHYLTGHPQDGLDEAALLAIRRLQQHYTARSDAAPALERVRQHLARQTSRHVEQSMPGREGERQRENPSVRPGKKRPRQTHHLVGLLSAAALCLLLVGSAVLLVYQAHLNSHCHTGSLCAATAPHQPVQQLYATTIDGMKNGVEAVYRLDPATDKPLWQFTMNPVSLGTASHGFAEYPLQTENGIFYLNGTDTDGYYLYALNASNGSLLWKFRYDPRLVGPGSLLAGQGPLIANNTVYLSEYSQSQGYTLIFALDALNGKTRWQQRYNGVPGNTSYGVTLVAATAKTLYTTSLQRHNQQESLSLSALSVQNGAKLWQKSFANEGEMTTWQLANGILYLATSVQNAAKTHIYAYDAATGNLRWSTGIEGLLSRGAMNVVQNTLYIAISDTNATGSLYALRDGSLLWQQSLTGRVLGMTVANNAIYTTIQPVGANVLTPPQLAAFRANDGHADWQRTLDAGPIVQEKPVVYENSLYLGAVDSNRITVFDCSNGKVIRTFMVGNEMNHSGNSVAISSLTE